MRRILVPLDGTPMAASIIPDARRLAGPDGTLILVRHASRPTYGPQTDTLDTFSVDESEDYLNETAARLEAEGVRVEVHLVALGDVSVAIDEAAIVYRADMIACSTHGRSPLGRLLRGGVTWKVLAHSTVPVLLRNTQRPTLPTPDRRRILVPLDQSDYGERAIPLARALQGEWYAEVFLTTVVHDTYTYATASMTWPPPYRLDDGRKGAAMYLRHAAAAFHEAELRVLVGTPTIQLVDAVREWLITDIVMTSHGRTGLARAVLGSVADELVHELSIPIIVIPSLAVAGVEREPSAAASETGTPLTPVG